MESDRKNKKTKKKLRLLRATYLPPAQPKRTAKIHKPSVMQMTATLANISPKELAKLKLSPR